MAVLVTGGAGYIGSITVDGLLSRGEAVAVVDNLSRGHPAAVHPAAAFYRGDAGDRQLIRRIAQRHEIEACLHFAAFAYVGESVSEPARYFENNVVQGIALLGELIACGIRKFIFSSTCATYGEPCGPLPISEDHPQKPANPYGWSKLFVERVLESYSAAFGLQFVALRYFNAAGATSVRGEDHSPETHLIPCVLNAAARRTVPVEIYGDDYPTPDGTAVRDYIHVEDLAAAHLLALEHLRRGRPSQCVNLGTGRGYSVREVVGAAGRVTGRPIDTVVRPRRPGDPSHLVASYEKARRVLGWEPAYRDLDRIVATAWEWHKSHPHGYGSDTRR